MHQTLVPVYKSRVPCPKPHMQKHCHSALTAQRESAAFCKCTEKMFTLASKAFTCRKRYYLCFAVYSSNGCFPGMSAKNARSSSPAVSWRSEASSALDSRDPLISPLLSHWISVCRSRSPYSTCQLLQHNLKRPVLFSFGADADLMMVTTGIITWSKPVTYGRLVNDAVGM